MPEAFFVPASTGQRFCLFYSPDTHVATCGAVVHVHSFAEEMNKSRRMAALQARALASAGYAVLQIDLFGCGDSSGEFADASWEGWIEDVRLACDWLQQHSNAVPWLWGLRSGCLLAAETAKRSGQPYRLLLWQPVVSGKQFLQQFLRLKLASEITSETTSGGKQRMAELHERLAQGETIEVAGYPLSRGLTNALVQAQLDYPPQSPQVVWLEISNRPDGVLSPVAADTLAQWQADGYRANGMQVHGPAFWQTSEITECPALIDATIQAMAESLSP